MNDNTLQGFRDIAAAMQIEPTNWQWIGPYSSQRMFGITEIRAREYARRHGGSATEMVAKWKPETDPLDQGDNLGESPDY